MVDEFGKISTPCAVCGEPTQNELQHPCFLARTRQPKWKVLEASDSQRLLVDETGVYPPELEIAQEIHDSPDGSTFELFRFPLDRLKVVRGYLVPFRYEASWPHPLPSYVEWFAESLGEVADCCDTTIEELSTALCSDDPNALAWAYESIGSYHGFLNLDGYPLTLSEADLDARWDRG